MGDIIARSVSVTDPTPRFFSSSFSFSLSDSSVEGA